MAGGMERASGFLGIFWPIIERASGVTLLVMLLMIALAYLEIKRVHHNNELLVEKLLATKDAQLAWLQQHVHCAPAGASGGER